MSSSKSDEEFNKDDGKIELNIDNEKMQINYDIPVESEEKENILSQNLEYLENNNSNNENIMKEQKHNNSPDVNNDVSKVQENQNKNENNDCEKDNKYLGTKGINENNLNLFLFSYF